MIVWIDPIDATKEYTLGPEYLPEVTILIGIALKGKPIAGVVNQPFYGIKENGGLIDDNLGRTVWGIVGCGAYDSINGNLIEHMERINRINAHTANKPNRIITTRVPLTDLIRRDFESIPNSEIRFASGAGYKVLALIDNIADCYLFAQMGTMRWDTCAVEAIVASLNGSLTDVFTKEYSYTQDQRQLPHNFFGVLATLNKQNAYFASFISTELKEKLINDAHMLKIKMKVTNI